jgi:hypothetical protein
MVGPVQLTVVAGLYALLMAVLNTTVIASMDRHVLLAGAVGLTLGSLIIVGGVSIGEPLLVTSVAGFKALTIAAATGALLGHLSTVTTIAPANRTP